MLTQKANLKTGTIVLWKQYGIISKLCHKLFRKKLPYNRLFIVTNDSSFIVNSNNHFIFLEPKKNYSKLEKKLLLEEINSWFILVAKYEKCNSELRKDCIRLINNVRPETIPFLSTLDDLLDNPYYRVRND